MATAAVVPAMVATAIVMRGVPAADVFCAAHRGTGTSFCIEGSDGSCGSTSYLWSSSAVVGLFLVFRLFLHFLLLLLGTMAGSASVVLCCGGNGDPSAHVMHPVECERCLCKVF